MLVKVGNTADKETRKKGRFREGLPIDNLFLFFTFLFSWLLLLTRDNVFPCTTQLDVVS